MGLGGCSLIPLVVSASVVVLHLGIHLIALFKLAIRQSQVLRAATKLFLLLTFITVAHRQTLDTLVRQLQRFIANPAETIFSLMQQLELLAMP